MLKVIELAEITQGGSTDKEKRMEKGQCPWAHQCIEGGLSQESPKRREALSEVGGNQDYDTNHKS